MIYSYYFGFRYRVDIYFFFGSLVFILDFRLLDISIRYYSGDFYVGEWANGLWNGQGHLTLRNGDSTNGVFVNGKRNGRCVTVYATGETYEGEYKVKLYCRNIIADTASLTRK